MSFQKEKNFVREYFADLEACKTEDTLSVLKKYVSDDYTWEGVYPFMDISGAEAVVEKFWAPVKNSLKSMQRRQDVFMAGEGTDKKIWVMSMGQFMGLFDEEFLNIRPTGKMQHLQYVEWARVEDGKITHSAMFVDLLGFMKEAGCYPLPPETGHYFVYPGPRDHNGLMFEEQPAEKAPVSFAIVDDMINDLDSINAGYEAPADMLKKSWNDDMIWYGPCGVGASYTIPRYQIQHQRPFRENMSNKSVNEIKGYFAEGDFVCFFCSMNTSHDGGWLGMTGNDKIVNLRGDLDVYYCKDGKISENWCLFDIPYWLYQQGFDVFKRTASILNPSF